MQKLLYLVHRLPYPPNKGDKIRAFHFLRALAEHYQVYLGTFIDDPDDRRYLADLQAYCREVLALELNPKLAKWASLRGLASGEPLTLPYYRDARLQDWVDQILANTDIRQALIISSPMAQYLDRHPRLRMIADLVDVDSEKWRQYADSSSWPMRWLYRREADKLLACEQLIAERAAATLLVSAAEAALLQQRLPAVNPRVGYVPNGVDSEFFDPAASYPSPYAANQTVAVFTGVMDYWPNIDAVVWFAEQVWPLVRRQRPDGRFYIVGAKPARQVLQLAKQDASIVVTGRVDDVRPFLAHARLAVAPLRIARGVQNKVLEAMAMAKPLVATPAAIEGITTRPRMPELCIEDQPQPFAERVLAAFEATSSAIDNRRFVQERFSWAHSARQLLDALAIRD